MSRPRPHRLEYRRAVEAAFALGGIQAAFQVVEAHRRTTRCPDCQGQRWKGRVGLGEGQKCGSCRGTGILDPNHPPPLDLHDRAKLVRKICPDCGWSDGVDNENQRCDRCGATWED